MWLHKFIAVLCALNLCGLNAAAENMNWSSLSPSEDLYRSRISEYFFMRTGKELLQPVRVLGNIQKPGLYHVPTNTSLISLLAISGGPDPSADTGEINVVHSDGKSQKTTLKNLMKVGSDIDLKAGDIIFVPKEQHFFDNSTTNFILAVTSILGVGLTAIVVSRGH